ncbi:MAG: MtrB/PioB family outer membrane beta-barrel protein [Desulfuromonadales bacterium]|nr:MtrB/PioB family outer membrane beta-barrel protein [Desulfuromonadales bacterium]
MNPFKYILFCTSLFALSLSCGEAIADTGEIADDLMVFQETKVTLGYQSFSLRDEPGRAAEYRSFSSSPTFGLNYFKDNQSSHFSVDSNYLSDEDFNAEVTLNKGSLLRLNLRTERFYHNLDHIPYDNGNVGDGFNRTPDHAPAEGSRPDGEFSGQVRTYYTDQDPKADYGQKIDINEVKVRAKLPTYPAHLNLAYWQIEKSGHKQMRFADENCTGCHMQSKTRKIDRVTREIKGSLDGHFGYVDLEAIALYREFEDRESIPTDLFGGHGRGRSPGDYEHSEDPESTVKEVTINANTSPSGGLVANTSLTIGKRENESDISSIYPIKAEMDYWKTSTNVTYTPSKTWTINLRHRYLDVDNDNNSSFPASGHGTSNPNDLEVRDSIDFTRAWYEIISNYRPSNSLTFKAELRREDIDRDNTGLPEEHHSSLTSPVEINSSWQLPDEESITKLKVGFHSRHLEKSALKFSGWASLRHSDDPSYGTSFSDSYELFLSSRYAPSPFWGLSASLNLLDEKNDDRTALQFDDNPANEFAKFDLDRDRTQQNFSLGGWLIPAERVSLDFSYGYLATQTEQDLLFGAQPNTAPGADSLNFTIENENVEYEQTVHTLSAGVSWQALENLSFRAEGYHIRSEAYYEPDFDTVSLDFFRFSPFGVVPGTASSSELKSISKIDIRQNGIKARINWQVDDQWSCGFDASYDDYDDKDSNIFDGSVVSYMASLTRIW